MNAFSEFAKGLGQLGMAGQTAAMRGKSIIVSAFLRHGLSEADATYDTIYLTPKEYRSMGFDTRDGGSAYIIAEGTLNSVMNGYMGSGGQKIADEIIDKMENAGYLFGQKDGVTFVMFKEG